ncbi:MAG: HPr family phosphocarrier protein [Oscillospiraceae bacterium]|nr:HPr family phosphocarrier protein [Oscillospiraceae bacterium]
MYASKVCFETVEDAKNFAALCAGVPFSVTLSSGVYIVDAKSIMGVFSLDLNVELDLKADCAEDEPFIEKLSDFIRE